MARTIAAINTAMKADYVTQRAAASMPFDDPSLWSGVNRKRLQFYIMSVAIWVMENLLDAQYAENLAIIANTKPHTLQWYAGMAKAFQYGYNVVQDTDYYDNTGLTDAQVAASKVISYAAVTKQQITQNKSGLRLKTAFDNGTDLQANTAPQMVALETYFVGVANRPGVGDAGVDIQFTTGPADALKLNLFIKYNPLILNDQGQRANGTANTPVQDAINIFLKNLPFNGRMELAELIKAIQAVDGVVSAYIVNATAQFGAEPFTAIADYIYEPDAGYLRIYNPSTDLLITWEAAT